MEPLDNSLKNIVQFILCIQDACDKHRKCMEHLWQEEYASYVNEWKPSQIESKPPSFKKKEVKSHKASKCVQMDLGDKCDDLELILADSLLEKARNLRTKNKKLVNGLIDCKSLSTFCNDKVITSSMCRDSKQFLENKRRKGLPHSKSDFIINSHKSCIVPFPKSSSVPFMLKDCSETVRDNQKCTIISSKTSIAKHTSNKSKTSNDFAVISSKDLDRLKNLQLNTSPGHKSKGKQVILSSDASDKTNQRQISSHPSSTEFINLMTGRLNAISPGRKLRLWYPFVSFKSESFLTAFNYDSFPSIKKVYSILYSIQETMMWIDLLHLLETEICPNLLVDATDVNSLTICSYLRSIFHPNSQRIPIIFPV